jgi:hypothetical protein
MDLQEINDLINIRKYVANSLENHTIDRATVNVLNGMLILIDNKIIKMLQNDSFKEYIGYKDVRKAIEEVARITNIKSGIIK